MVQTRLAAIRSKKYILPAKDSLNNSSIINEHNDNDDAASNIVIDNANIEAIVPETQTQIVYATQQGSTGLVDDKDQLPKDCCKAPKLEKTPVSSTTGEKSPHKACKITSTPPSKNKTGHTTSSFIPSRNAGTGCLVH